MSTTKSLSDGKTRREYPRLRRYKETLLYAKYCLFHPFDGFWDLVHEKRGSLAAAHTFLVLFLLTYVLRLMLTSFQFVTAPIQYINIYERFASLLLPFLILCVANWSLSTLFDGKGRFKDIYMGLCYSLVPYIIIQLPLILLSHILAFDEGAFYNVLGSLSIIWCLLLAFVALMQIHDYGPGKTLVFIFATIFGALVIIFLLLVFFSLLSDAFGYFASLYREILFRLS